MRVNTKTSATGAAGGLIIRLRPADYGGQVRRSGLRPIKGFGPPAGRAKSPLGLFAVS